MSLIQSAQPARAFITRPHGRYEVIVKDTFMHEGVLMARVCFVADLQEYSIDYPFEFPASCIEVETEQETPVQTESETVEVVTWNERWQPVVNLVPKFTIK